MERGAGVIEPHYPKGKRGRPPVGLERMLRVYLVQQWYNLSDEGAEDEITDSQALRGFVGIDLSRESAPDATTLLQFRHLLEKHELTKKVFEAINGKLSAAGLMMRRMSPATDKQSLSVQPAAYGRLFHACQIRKCSRIQMTPAATAATIGIRNLNAEIMNLLPRYISTSSLICPSMCRFSAM